MKKNFGVIFFSVIIYHVSAQTPGWGWAKTYGGIGEDASYSITLDAAKNVYTSGAFYNTVDFDPGVGVYNLNSNGASDIFVSKLDSSGNFIWAKQIGGASIDLSSSIASDGNGNVYITGDFKGMVDFDPGNGTFNLISNGNFDIFICKLDSNGNFVWAKSIGGSTADHSKSLTTDNSGNVYTTGNFVGTVDFDPNFGIINLTSAGTSPNAFISKLNSSGNFVLAKQMSGINISSGFSIAVDKNGSGDIFTTGTFFGTTDFDPGAGSFNLTASGTQDIFVSKLDSFGNFIWAKRFGGLGYNFVTSIAIDQLGSGDVYTTGSFINTVDFNPDSSANFSLTSLGSYDIFISKLNSSGNFVWVKQLGGIEGDFGNAVVEDFSGNIYTLGYFQDTADFNPDSNLNFNLAADTFGFMDIFISKLNNSGNFVWAKTMSGASNDYGSSIIIDSSENIYVTGEYESPSIVFDSLSLVNVNGTGTFADIFIAKLSQQECLPSNFVLEQSSCNNFISPSSNYSWSTSGIYHDTIPNAAGCDSIITINLTINSVDTSVTQIDNSITSNANGATYQWLDCNTNMQAISGATNQLFYSPVNIVVALAVTENGCIDTTECYSIVVGINEISNVNSFQIYPNPTEDNLTVLVSHPFENCSIEITNTLGQIIYSKKSNSQSEILNLQTFPLGIYFLKVISADGNSVVKKFIKQ